MYGDHHQSCIPCLKVLSRTQGQTAKKVANYCESEFMGILNE